MTVEPPPKTAVHDPRRVLLVATLSLVTLSVPFHQAAVVPVLDLIGRQLGASGEFVGWLMTANLLAAAASTPLIGRLVDIRSKKKVLLVALALVAFGSLLGAVATSTAVLIVGRILQGVAFALYPVAVSILRDEIDPEHQARLITALSAMLGFGGALGLVTTGLLMTGDASYHRTFWQSTVLAVAVLVAAAFGIPSRARRMSGPIDWVGALGLAVGLSLVLMAISQGRVWGWQAPATIASALIGFVVLRAWWSHGVRCAQPLVSTRMLTRRPILFASAATLFVSMGLYFSLLGVTAFVEDSAGINATVLTTSVDFLLPGALAAGVTSLAASWLIGHLGARVVSVVGASMGLVGFLMLLFWHSTPWHVIAASLLTNAYASLGYGALLVLLLEHVPAEEAEAAGSLNAVVRMVGATIGAALTGALLETGTLGQHPEAGFDAVFGIAAITAFGVISLVVGNRRTGAAT